MGHPSFGLLLKYDLEARFMLLFAAQVVLAGEGLSAWTTEEGFPGNRSTN